VKIGKQKRRGKREKEGEQMLLFEALILEKMAIASQILAGM